MKADTYSYTPITTSPCSHNGIFADYLHQCLEQLCGQLPIDGIWGVTREGGVYERVEVINSRPWPAAVVSYLAAEADWQLPTRPLEIDVLTVPEALLPNASPQATWFYSCGFGIETEPLPEYLLLGSSQPLQPIHQFCLQQQATLLYQWRHCQRRLTEWSKRLQQITLDSRQARHQLVSALSTVDLHAAVLEQQLPPGSQKTSVQQIRQAMVEANAYLEEMAIRSQGRPLKLQTWSVNDLLQQCLKELAPWLKQKQLRVICPEEEIELTFDRWQMQQVLKNVLTNAIQFGPVNSSISCQWQVFQREILLQITDQGPGLSLEDQANLFNPFYTRRQGGTGLGLAIAAQIIHAHQGSIWASNLPQGGAQICISLPKFPQP